MKRRAPRLVQLALAAYLLVLVVIWYNQEMLLFPGWDGPSASAIQSVPGLQSIEAPHPDGTIRRGWWRQAATDAPTLVIFHGNAGFQWRKLPAFAARGWGLLLVPYGGFAGNPGAPSEASLMEDARAALAFAREKGVRPEDTVLYGESLGSGVAARMALEPGNWRGVVLDAPYTSVANRAAEIYWFLPVHTLIRHQFDTAAIIDQITAPILIMHGSADKVIPIDHGRALYDLVSGKKAALWVEGGSHFLPPDRVTDAVAAKFDSN